MTLDVPVQDKNEWRVQPLDLASEIRMQLILKSILQEHLEGYPTTFEEDNTLLAGDLDWATTCCVTFRRNEKATLHWLIAASEKII